LIPPTFASFYNEAVEAAEGELKRIYMSLCDCAQAFGWPPSEINNLYISGGEPHESLAFWADRADAIIKARAKIGKI
jgi:hypothetical protein